MNHEAALSKLTDLLRLALGAPNLEDSRLLVVNALVRAEKLRKAVATEVIKGGRKGGVATTQLDTVKRRGGGRPKK